MGFRPSLFQNLAFKSEAQIAREMQQNLEQYKFTNPTFVDPVMSKAAKEYYGIWSTFSEILGQNITDIPMRKNSGHGDGRVAEAD